MALSQLSKLDVFKLVSILARQVSWGRLKLFRRMTLINYRRLVSLAFGALRAGWSNLALKQPSKQPSKHTFLSGTRALPLSTSVDLPSNQVLEFNRLSLVSSEPKLRLILRRLTYIYSLIFEVVLQWVDRPYWGVTDGYRQHAACNNIPVKQ